MMRLSCTVIGALLLVCACGLVATVTAQAPPPSGTLSISTTSIAVGVGANWGDGTLTTQGKRYRFTVQGLEVGAVGVSKVQATGKVYHLGKVADFEGTYVAAEGGATVGAGAGVLTMRNQHGVVIDLQSVQRGVKLTAGVGGITIALKK
jgi:hypothetical protein